MNKAVFGIMLAALAGGGVVGAAMMGVIEIPGLSPAKKAAGAAALYEGDKAGDPKAPGAEIAKSPDAGPTADAAKPADSKDAKSGTTAAGAKPADPKDPAGAKAADASKQPDAAGPPAASTPKAVDPAKPSVADSPKAGGASAVPPAPVGAPPPGAKPAVTRNPQLGIAKAAKLWNEMSIDAIVVMVKKYKAPDLAAILAKMDTSKVAKVLEKLALDDKTSALAVTLTKDIQREASKR